jgi:hypothetical protein
MLRSLRIIIGASVLSLGSAACTKDIAQVELTCAKGIDCVFTHENFQIFVPALAIPEGLRFTAMRVDDPPDSLTIVPGATWDLGPDGTTFHPAATAIITLPSNALDALDGVRLTELAVYRRTDENDEWVRVPLQVANTQERRFTATLTGLSVYTVMATPAFSVSLTQPTQHTIQTGGTVQLDADVQAEDGTALPDRPVIWDSENDGIATVNANGLVSGVAAGTTTVTARSGTAQSSRSIVVEAPPTGPPPASTEPVPGVGDVIIYDDDFSGFATMAARHARRNQLIGGVGPFYFYDGPDAGSSREALDSIITPGMAGSPFAYRIRMPAELNNYYQATMNAEIFHRPAVPSVRFNPPGTTLVVDMWLRVNLPRSNFLWIKGLELFHSFDRTQYSLNPSSATMGWANILAQSNQREVNMHIENGAADAPKQFRRWEDISNSVWRKHTFVYKASSGTGVARDGVNRWFVDGEKIIDASLAGLNSGWMLDRQNGVSASSTAPFPGNVGEKYTNVTGEQALLGLADDPVISIVWPGIISASAAGGGGTLDVGRIRVWYRAP